MYHKPIVISAVSGGLLAFLQIGWAVLVVATLIALAVIVSRLLPRTRTHKRDRHERYDERDEHGRFRRRD